MRERIIIRIVPEGGGMKITLKDLRRMGACSGQVELYKSLFGTEVELTREAVVQYGAQFDLNWIAPKIMSEAQYADYLSKHAPLEADYESKRDALDADYVSKRAPLYADYVSKHAPLYADYVSKRDALDADYLSKRDALYADYVSKRDALDADYDSKRDALFADILGL